LLARAGRSGREDSGAETKQAPLVLPEAFVKPERHLGADDVAGRPRITDLRHAQRGPRVRRVRRSLRVVLRAARRERVLEDGRPGDVLLDVDLELAIEQAEEVHGVADRLRRPEQEMRVGVERVVKDAHHLPLEGTLQIDEHVPAGDEIEPRERRILAQVVPREDDHVADHARDLVALVGAHEEATEPLGGDVELDVGRVGRRARARERAVVHVGGEDLDLERARAVAEKRHTRIAAGSASFVIVWRYVAGRAGVCMYFMTIFLSLLVNKSAVDGRECLPYETCWEILEPVSGIRLGGRFDSVAQSAGHCEGSSMQII